MVDDRIDIPPDLPVPLQPPRRRTAQLLWSVLQLICGVVIGTGATIYILRDHITWNRLKGPNRPDAIIIVHDMQSRYGLTDDQFKRVSDLVQGSLDKKWSMGKTFFEQMAAEDARVKEQMRTILTPEQFSAYAEDMRQMAERHEKRRPPFFREGDREGGPRGPGPGGPGGPRGPGRQREDSERPGSEQDGPGPRFRPDGQPPQQRFRGERQPQPTIPQPAADQNTPPPTDVE